MNQPIGSQWYVGLNFAKVHFSHLIVDTIVTGKNIYIYIYIGLAHDSNWFC